MITRMEWPCHIADIRPTADKKVSCTHVSKVKPNRNRSNNDCKTFERKYTVHIFRELTHYECINQELVEKQKCMILL